MSVKLVVAVSVELAELFVSPTVALLLPVSVSVEEYEPVRLLPVVVIVADTLPLPVSVKLSLPSLPPPELVSLTVSYSVVV